MSFFANFSAAYGVNNYGKVLFTFSRPHIQPFLIFNLLFKEKITIFGIPENSFENFGKAQFALIKFIWLATVGLSK